VVRTSVGYAGGTTPEPKYHRLGDHVEVVQIDYNPLLVFQEVEAKFKTLSQLLRSTAVARLNGYVGGFGTPAELELELPTFGFSQGAEQRLREHVASY